VSRLTMRRGSHTLGRGVALDGAPHTFGQGGALDYDQHTLGHLACLILRGSCGAPKAEVAVPAAFSTAWDRAPPQAPRSFPARRSRRRPARLFPHIPGLGVALDYAPHTLGQGFALAGAPPPHGGRAHAPPNLLSADGKWHRRGPMPAPSPMAVERTAMMQVGTHAASTPIAELLPSFRHVCFLDSYCGCDFVTSFPVDLSVRASIRVLIVA